MPMRSKYRKVLAAGAMAGFALPMLAAPAVATPPGDWPALPPQTTLAPTEAPQQAALRKPVQQPRGMTGRIYRVQPGDTLWAIAQKTFGDPTRWPELYQANRSRLASAHLIRPDQTLELGSVQQASRGSARKTSASSGGSRYVVKPGDTLGTIARRHFGKASQWPVLYSLNQDRLADPHRIFPGQELRLPSRRRETVVVAPQATIKPAGRKVSRKTDDGRLLKGHRRVHGSYYARSQDGRLIWADTREAVRPDDSTLKTKLAPKIRQAFKVPEPKPAPPAVRKKPVPPPAAISRPVASSRVFIELPASQKPALMPASSQERLSAGALSLIVPGAGQLYNGDPTRGALFMGAGVAGLGATIYGLASNRQDIGVAASAGLVALSLWSAADAYLNAPPKPAP